MSFAVGKSIGDEQSRELSWFWSRCSSNYRDSTLSLLHAFRLLNVPV